MYLLNSYILKDPYYLLLSYKHTTIRIYVFSFWIFHSDKQETTDTAQSMKKKKKKKQTY